MRLGCLPLSVGRVSKSACQPKSVGYGKRCLAEGGEAFGIQLRVDSGAVARLVEPLPGLTSSAK